jgi:predicted XRE-type DNA-binding protein
MTDDEQTVTTVHDELFEILGIPNAADELARVDLACAITREIRRRGLTQAQAAKLLGIKQPDISAIMNARTSGFSQERLERLLNALDMEVRIQVGPRPAHKERAGITVQMVESF